MLARISRSLNCLKPYPLKSFSSLTALSPLDGRYNKQTSPLQPYFSESALMKYEHFFLEEKCKFFLIFR